MCTVVLLRRPDHRWPLILAANRDEMESRPWRPPDRHWPDRPDVIGGLDELAGGTWLGINDNGVVSGVLNRKESLGPDETLRSRGELPLEALEHADAVAAADALSHLDPNSWRSFNLFIADNRDAYWIRSLGPGSDCVELSEVPEGVSILTAWGLDSPDSARTRYFRPRFEEVAPPDPGIGAWKPWEKLMASKEFEPGADPGEAIFVARDRGFGTLSTSLIALESPTRVGPRRIWRFSAKSTNFRGFTEVAL